MQVPLWNKVVVILARVCAGLCLAALVVLAVLWLRRRSALRHRQLSWECDGFDPESATDDDMFLVCSVLSNGSYYDSCIDPGLHCELLQACAQCANAAHAYDLCTFCYSDAALSF
jgi:hypothetical protein